MLIIYKFLAKAVLCDLLLDVPTVERSVLKENVN